MNRKIRRGIKQRVVVVLDGLKASSSTSENSGLAPLSKAMHDVVGPEDKVLVLTLLYWNMNIVAPTTTATAVVPPSLPSLSNDDLNYENNMLSIIQTCESPIVNVINPDLKFLHQEICQRKEAYTRVFKPFYLSCETYGVNFEVKIAAGFLPKEIVIEEANSVKANWIIMDRCFTKDPSFQQLGKTKRNIISVNDDGEAIFHHRSSETSPPSSSSSTAAVINKPIFKSNPRSLKLRKEPTKSFGKKALNAACCYTLPSISEPSSPSSLVSSCDQSKQDQLKNIMDQGSTSSSTTTTLTSLQYHSNNNNNNISSRKYYCDANALLGLPLKLSKEEMEEITFHFSKRVSSDENEQFVVYDGFCPVNRCRVSVKMLRGDSGGVFLESEKRAAWSMRHKNILRLIGYHQSDNTTFLVFPHAERGTLEYSNLISDLRVEDFKLTFEDKLNIAIGIAQGLRYMHEECPRGPIVHGNLLLSNVFLGEDLRPQISGFGRAKWLHLKQAWPIFDERYFLFEDHLNDDLMAQIKSDVLSFGVLLLRLFCRRSVPQDDDTLIKWAKPLLLERAFYVLLHDDDEDSEDIDMHEMFRVMCTAFQCAMTRPDNRPYMSEVISYLKGESFCVMESSPLSYYIYRE